MIYITAGLSSGRGEILMGGLSCAAVAPDLSAGCRVSAHSPLNWSVAILHQGLWTAEYQTSAQQTLWANETQPNTKEKEA